MTDAGAGLYINTVVMLNYKPLAKAALSLAKTLEHIDLAADQCAEVVLGLSCSCAAGASSEP